MPFLLNNWRICLGIALFAIYSAFLYRIGSAPYRAEIAAMKAAGKTQNAKTAATDITTKGIAHEADKTAAAGFAAIDKHYAAPRVRKPSSSRPVSPDASIAGQLEPSPEERPLDTCNDRDSAHDAYQVIELQRFYSEIAATINR